MAHWQMETRTYEKETYARVRFFTICNQWRPLQQKGEDQRRRCFSLDLVRLKQWGCAKATKRKEKKHI